MTEPTISKRELPELHQAELGPETLEALFADLQTLTQILTVIPKATRGHIQPEYISLAQGRELILNGKLRGLQIRYMYDGDEWWDTLIITSNGIRITRIKQEYSYSEEP